MKGYDIISAALTGKFGVGIVTTNDTSTESSIEGNEIVLSFLVEVGMKDATVGAVERVAGIVAPY